MGLRTGCQGQALPRSEYAPGSTVHGRFRQGVAAGVVERAWQGLLASYEARVGIAWQWQARDGAITKAPLGGEATGPSPVERAKRGTTRSLLPDRRGAPLALAVTGANPPDKAVALETGEGMGGPRPARVVYRVHHTCLDKGYDSDEVLGGRLERDSILHLRLRGEPTPEGAPEKKHPARRGVVERTQAWHNKFRRLLVRWERRADHYKAMLHFASVFILFRLTLTA